MSKVDKTVNWQCVLVCWGDKYTDAEVNFLWRKITEYDKNCSHCVLFTDKVRDGIHPSIHQKRIPAFYVSPEMIGSGCHAKLCIFEEGMLEASMPAIYVDLDTVVLGPLGELLWHLKSSQHLMMIPGRGRIRKLRQIIARYRGGKKFPRANSSIVVFYPKFWANVASSFRGEIESGAKLEGERLITDDRYLAWFAQRQLQSVPTTQVVKFGTEFVLAIGLLSKIKGRLPWVQRRRANLLAITLPGGDFKLESLARLTDGDVAFDSRGRPLFWDAKTIGVTKEAIVNYANDLYQKP